MGIAIVIVSLVLVSAMTSVLEALQLQREADQLALAMSFMQSKLAELEIASQSDLTDSSGEITESNSIYYGYKWQITIKEENINFTEILSNSFGGLPIDDKLPAGVVNKGKDSPAASSKSLGSIAEVPILRISAKVEYPKGKGVYGSYNIETMQRSERSKLYQRN